MQHSLRPLDKVTSSIRKEISKRLYTEYGVRKPVKSWTRGYNKDELKTILGDLEITLRWFTAFIGGDIDDCDDLGQRVFYPSISIRKINIDNFADEYSPHHEWYSRGYGDGYSENAWNSDPDEEIPYPDHFPNDEAEEAYSIGRHAGGCQAMLDE